MQLELAQAVSTAGHHHGREQTQLDCWEGRDPEDRAAVGYAGAGCGADQGNWYTVCTRRFSSNFLKLDVFLSLRCMTPKWRVDALIMLIHSVKIYTTLQNLTLEGTLFTACPITNLVVLNTTPPPPNPSSTLVSQPCDYHVIHISKVQSYQIQSLPNDAPRSDAALENGLFPIGKIDTKALKAREQAAIRKIKERDAMKGKGVSKEAQDVFDALART